MNDVGTGCDRTETDQRFGINRSRYEWMSVLICPHDLDLEISAIPQVQVKDGRIAFYLGTMDQMERDDLQGTDFIWRIKMRFSKNFRSDHVLF